ncbi:MAG: DNA repair protein RadC [Sphaerochaetaceae bacterium]|nr:DNA repair protein RadC [Sphaerochaetaceae bacterium]
MKYIAKEIEFKSIKEMPLENRPRERLQRLGARGINDIELLCVVLGSGSSARPVQDIASEILQIVDSKGEGGVSLTDLQGVDGLGFAKAASICASLELGRRMTSKKNSKPCNTPRAVYDNIRHYGDRQQEYFLCIMLNGANEIIGVNVVTMGLVNRTLVHPREVFSEPIRMRATSVVLAHNHPSGNLIPSADDIEVTLRMKKAGMILGIEVMDHIIFSSDDYRSMRESGDFIGL